MTQKDFDLPSSLQQGWATLSDHGPIDRDSLRLWLKGADVDEVLRELDMLGLAIQGEDGRWTAVDVDDLDTALQTRAERLVAQLRSVKQSNDSIATAGSLGLLHGLDAITAFLRERVPQASLVQGFDLPPYVNIRDDPSKFNDSDMPEIAPEWAILERGGQLQSVYHPDGFMNDPVKVEEIGTFIAKGEQARVGRVHTKLLLFDREEALIGLLSSYREGVPENVWSLRTDIPILVEAFASQFDAAWESAVPWLGPGGAKSRWEDRRERLVKYLLSGFDRSAILADGGFSDRTLRREIDQLRADMSIEVKDPFLAGVRVGVILEQSRAQDW